MSLEIKNRIALGGPFFREKIGLSNALQLNARGRIALPDSSASDFYGNRRNSGASDLGMWKRKCLPWFAKINADAREISPGSEFEIHMGDARDHLYSAYFSPTDRTHRKADLLGK